LILNGEIDKQKHPFFKKLDEGYAKPDFLIHIPGSMDENYAIIEVKHSITTEGILKDLNTLNIFIQKALYKRGIYLIYGDEANANSFSQIESTAAKFTEIGPIEVWLHKEAGQPAVLHSTIQKTKKNSVR
jgi:hypothetical protein